MNLGAANRDPARWDDPDRFDPYRDAEAEPRLRGRPHVCLGMHVARAEMFVAMNAVLDRLPNLRFDPDAPDGADHRARAPRAQRHPRRLRRDRQPTEVAMTEYRLISSDSHVTMPDDAWQEYLDPEFRDRAPRIERTDDGDFRVFEGKRHADHDARQPRGEEARGVLAQRPQARGPAGGRRRSGRAHHRTWTPTASTPRCSTWAVRCCRRIPRCASTACAATTAGCPTTRRYAPRRLLGMAAIPIDTPERAVEEIHFAAAQPGLAGGYIPLFPPEGDYGDAKWNPMWEAFRDTGMPDRLCTSVAAARARRSSSIYESAPRFMTGLVMSKLTMAESVSELIHGLVMQRYPDLKFIAVEGQIGWISFFLYYSDHLWEKHRFWTKSELEHPPSHYFQRQVFAHVHGGPRRPARARAHRDRQHHVGERLPALRDHVAELQGPDRRVVHAASATTRRPRSSGRTAPSSTDCSDGDQSPA